MSESSPAPIRILHFADLHLGLERYGARRGAEGLPARAQDTLRSLDELIAGARAEPPDLILFAGDAFPSSRPEPTLLRAFAERVLALAEVAPLVLLVGRSDAPPSAERASSLAIFATLPVPRVLVADVFAVHRIETERGALTLATAPYVIPREGLAERLQELAQGAAAVAGPRVLLGHFPLAGAESGDEGTLAEEAIPLAALAGSPWDYVALGGIHRHQQLPGADGAPLVYPGSLERLDFSAAAEAKGYVRAELRPGQVDWRFVPLAARRFVCLPADLREASDPIEAFRAVIAEAELDGAIVRAELKLTREQDEALTERIVRQLLRAAGAEHVAASRREPSGPLPTRLKAEDGEPAQLLERYLELRGEARGQAFSPEERAVLLDAAREIWTEVAEENSAAG